MSGYLMMSGRRNYLLKDTKEIVKIGELFGIRYYLKYYNISMTPAIEHFMSQTYEKAFDTCLYNRKDSFILKNLIYLILYSNPKPITELIRSEKKKLEIYENMHTKSKIR